MISLDIEILYQNKNLVVCEKPVGIISESPGLPDLIEMQTGKHTWPVNRLDQGTGGLCVLAFSSAACAEMQKVFRQENVQKRYMAVISGKPEDENGVFTDLLFHDKRNNKTFIVNRRRNGVKEASLSWKLVRTVSCNGSDMSLVSISLHSGRSHQIRIQFASRGMPLIGDGKYGSRIKADAPALWAAGISFADPFDMNKTVNVVSVPPASFPWNMFADDL